MPASRPERRPRSMLPQESTASILERHSSYIFHPTTTMSLMEHSKTREWNTCNADNATVEKRYSGPGASDKCTHLKSCRRLTQRQKIPGTKSGTVPLPNCVDQLWGPAC